VCVYVCVCIESAKPVSVFPKLLDAYGQQFTSRWIGIMGDHHVPRFNSLRCCFVLWLLCHMVVTRKASVGLCFYSYLQLALPPEKNSWVIKTAPRMKLKIISFLHSTSTQWTVFAVCCSIGEYERHLLESGAFIFYGTERFVDYLPPHKLASLNLPSKYDWESYSVTVTVTELYFLLVTVSFVSY